MEKLSVAADSAARREMLRAIFTETLDAIDVRSVFRRLVSCRDGVLRLSGLTYTLSGFRRVIMIAIGKAAVPSAEVVIERASESAAQGMELQAIVVGPGDLHPGAFAAEQWTGSHPIPDVSAREAARRIVELLRGSTAEDLVIFLISGGASAMVELPIDESITVEEIAEFYRTLVHSGLNIAEMNTLRKHVSAVKGGRLAQIATEAAKCTLLISDVPGAMADVIGSGPTLPDSSTRERCWQLMNRPELKPVPQRIRALLESADLAETPRQDATCFRNSAFQIVLSTATMLEAAAAACERRGCHAVIDNTCDEWDYRDAARYLLWRARELGKEHPRLCLLSGGEVQVQVQTDVGFGGRNQQFALYCAELLEQNREAISILSAGTDGIDGNSPAAGAVVDETTVERGRRAGFEVADSLARFDAYPLLERISDAIVTGPTGNNVRDLRIVMVDQGLER